MSDAREPQQDVEAYLTNEELDSIIEMSRQLPAKTPSRQHVVPADDMQYVIDSHKRANTRISLLEDEVKRLATAWSQSMRRCHDLVEEVDAAHDRVEELEAARPQPQPITINLNVSVNGTPGECVCECEQDRQGDGVIH